MFERLQKPFLTIETGEAYQPIRIMYTLNQKAKLIELLNQLKCCEKTSQANTWEWFWRDECDDLHFESLDSFKKNPTEPVRLGTLTVHEDGLFIGLPSFKRACMALPFFYKVLTPQVAKAHHADFVNKVFGQDEKLPHSFTELFKEPELQHIIDQRIHDYHAAQEKAEHSANADEAQAIIDEYTLLESKKRLPFAERHIFADSTSDDPDVIYLSFYIFLRTRELVAIRRWFGNVQYSLVDAAEETMDKVFGGMNIDIIE